MRSELRARDLERLSDRQYRIINYFLDCARQIGDIVGATLDFPAEDQVVVSVWVRQINREITALLDEVQRYAAGTGMVFLATRVDEQRDQMGQE